MNLKEISNMRPKKLKYYLFVIVMMLICYLSGVSDYIYTKTFGSEFNYPLAIDIQPVVRDVLAGKKPSVAPINIYPYRFLSNSGKCFTLDKIDLVIIVKSAMDHFKHRLTIRQTYGQENILPGRIIKTLFFLGIGEDRNSNTQKQINEEMNKYKDIIQMDFIDNYYNNTIKTMMSFRWAFDHCHIADFYLFTDDDMYISVNNLLNYVYDQTSTENSRGDIDNHFYAGYVFQSAPHRYRFSKWRVSLEEYPWSRWPTYVTAGAYVLSNKSMRTIYAGSYFVKHFRFDDIYLGIVARKVGINPTHCSQFYFYKKKYNKDDYLNVIASHGFDDHKELIDAWNEQNFIQNG